MKRRKTIALIGPESTGKSTLANDLARLTGGVCIPEYARTYVERLNRPYTQEDVLAIAQYQIKQLSQKEHHASFLFLDTELIVTKVWLLDRYGECPEWVEEAIQTYKPDLYLVCCPDLPFVSDPVRENGNRREELLRWYVREVERLQVPYVYIRGRGDARLMDALAAVRKFCGSDVV